MPERPLRPCLRPGCGTATRVGYCDEHAEYRKTQARVRYEDVGHMYNGAWRRYARAYLRDHRFCVRCRAVNRLVLATEVDHVKPHRGDQDLFWDTNNHQALCKPCHSHKTATEDSTFANQV